MSKRPEFIERTPTEQLIFSTMVRIQDTLFIALELNRGDVYYNSVESLVDILFATMPDEFKDTLKKINQRIREAKARCKKDWKNRRKMDWIYWGRVKYRICMQCLQATKMGLTQVDKDWWEEEPDELVANG